MRVTSTVFAVQAVEWKGPGDCVNSPGVCPNLNERLEMTHSMPQAGDA
jgi:hypothetical protein